MRHNWAQFVAALEDILGRIGRRRPRVAAAVRADDRPEEPDWDRGLRLLDSVLMPADEYSYLLCRLRNGRRYDDDGEVGAATYEMTLALRRVRALRRLYD